MKPFAAIVLAGGASRRMGGDDKLGLRIEGRTLLDHAIAGARAAGADPIVVVGPARDTSEPGVHWATEAHPGGGPVPGIAAGVDALDSGVVDAVAVVAGDAPFAGSALPRLVDALESSDAAILVDADGHDQYLVAAFKRDALLRALATIPAPAGMPVRRLFDGLNLARVPASGDEATDCDTPDDVVRVQALAAGQSLDDDAGLRGRETSASAEPGDEGRSEPL